ncbi:MAG: hypothetical protein R3B35_06805 [Gemmatimonadales bacterium]
MYATCLYCTAPLGANEVLETLPVGRRIAFDAAAGRLWVVCPACARWNLVPFDTRLETIDACERHFRDTRTRYSTDHIGLARLHEGLDLVRIGEALRPEFAAWRYGRVLRRRRPPVAGLGGHHAGGLAGRIHAALAGIGRMLVLPLVDDDVGASVALADHRILRDPWTDRLMAVPMAALVHASLHLDPEGRWHMEVPYRTGLDHLLGTDALQLLSIRDSHAVGIFRGDAVLPTLGRTLPVFERGRPAATEVTEATRLLEVTMGDPARLFPYVAGRPLRFETRRSFPLGGVRPELRLALEMSAHEETERRALEGELKLLERDWREAERVARIADGLALAGESSRQAPFSGRPRSV